MDDQLDLPSEGFLDNIENCLDFLKEDEAIGTMNSTINGEALGMLLEPVPAASKGEGCQVATNFESKFRDDDINYITDDWITKFLAESNLDIDLPAANDYMIDSDGTLDFPANDYIIINKEKDESHFQSSTPVSVLEHNNAISSSSSSSTSSSEIISLAPVGPAKPSGPSQTCGKRSRSQLSRCSSQILTPVIPLLPECESFEESCPRKKKIRNAVDPNDANMDTDSAAAAARKCMHCGIQKTPQWRAGPMGPKTLCNACGVRYNSGRLFPEYRPAASPTFVPSIHSNSHKKVVQMRNKGSQRKSGCDLVEYIRGATMV